MDVLVVGDPDPDRVEVACRAAEQRIRLPVNPVVLSRVEWEAASSGFVRTVRKGPLVPIREKDADPGPTEADL